MRGVWRIVVAAGTVAVGGCSAALLNAIAPQAGVDVVKSVPYASGARRTLDVYRPAKARGAPVIVFFYGGSWQNGSKDLYAFVGAALAGRGYVVVVPDYRVYPEVRYPSFLEDSAKAVAWAKLNARRYGGDPTKLVLMGHSAGAYNAAMLSTDRRWLAGVGLTPRRDVTAFVGLAGPYDFLPLQDDKLVEIFGGRSRTATQPITYVDGDEPPAFLAHGDLDDTVDPGNATRLAARMREVGDAVTVKRYARAGHATLIGAFSPAVRLVAPVLDDVDDFIARVTRMRRAPAGATR